MFLFEATRVNLGDNEKNCPNITCLIVCFFNMKKYLLFRIEQIFSKFEENRKLYKWIYFYLDVTPDFHVL